MRGTRRGSGLLLMLAMAVAGVVAVLLFNQARLTSWTSAELDTLVRGDAAETLADSAVQEAVARVRFAAADPRSPLYAALRRPLAAPATGALDLTTSVETPHAWKLSVETERQAYLVSPVDVRVSLQRPLDWSPYERFGVVRYRAEARSDERLGRAASRLVEAAQGFKVVLVSEPRPFCAFGLFVADGAGVTDLEAANVARGEFLQALGALWATVRTARAAAPAALTADYEALQGELVPEASAAERAKPLPVTDRAALYGLLEDGLEMALDKLDLAANLQQHLASARSFEARLDAAAARVAASPADADAHREFLAAARAVAPPVNEGLWYVWAFNRAFRVLPAADPAYPPLASNFGALEPDYWRRRVQYVVRPAPGEREPGPAFARFLADHGPLSGVVAVENGDAPLRLTGRLAGQVVLVTGRGGVSLQDFNVDEAPEDLVTVVSLGGPVTVTGEVHASVVLARADEAAQPSLTFAAGSTLAGNLYGWRLPPDTRLAGTLRRAEKYSSGLDTPVGRSYMDPRHLAVVFAPHMLYRKVARP